MTVSKAIAEETVMHPIYHDELNKARIADLRSQAERDRLVRACAQDRRARREYHMDPAAGVVGAFAHHLLIILGARSA